MGRAVRLDKIGVSGVDASVIGVVGAGVLEEDRDTEGNDTVRLAVLRLVKRAKPRACACTASFRDDVRVETVLWTVERVC
jgi:hypothetical protein